MVFFYKLAQAGKDAFFRRIEFYDEERDRVLVFLTNHLELAAATIASASFGLRPSGFSHITILPA